MTRHVLTLISNADRDKVRKYIDTAPVGARVQLQDPKRSIPQNERMWLILGKISNLAWRGQRYSEDEWKDYFMHAYRGEKWMPAEDGGMVPIGRSTSNLDKTEFGELMALMEAFCARQNISLPWVEA